MLSFLKSLTGVRSAIMALLLLAEVVFRGLGFETGPAFSVIHSIFTSVGWDPKAPGALLFDPALVGTALLTLWVTATRIKTWWAERHAEKPTVR